MSIRDSINIIERNEADSPEFNDEFIECLNNYLIGCLNYYSAADQSEKDRIIAAFDKWMPILSESFTVWRGMAISDYSDMYSEANIETRNDIKFHTFLSTSLDRDVAERFATLKGSFSNVIHLLFEMKTKPGTRGINLNDIPIELLDNRKNSEQEIILMRNSSFQITDRKKIKVMDYRGDWLDVNHIKMKQTG